LEVWLFALFCNVAQAIGLAVSHVRRGQVQPVTAAGLRPAVDYLFRMEVHGEAYSKSRSYARFGLHINLSLMVVHDNSVYQG